MKSTSVKRSLELAAVVASVAVFSMGTAYAQYGGAASGQSGASDTATGTAQQPGQDPYPYDILEEPMDSGYVDQEKREGRSKDPASPSANTHVPKYPVDKEGKPIKDPEHLQGGPIGPN